jgi:hypothetical protein
MSMGLDFAPRSGGRLLEVVCLGCFIIHSEPVPDSAGSLACKSFYRTDVLASTPKIVQRSQKRSDVVCHVQQAERSPLDQPSSLRGHAE